MQPSGAIFLRKFKHGGREDKGLVHVAALLTASIFCLKGRVFMDMVSRLVQAGILPDCAVETVAWFRQQGNDAGLDRYVNEVERRHEKAVFLAERKSPQQECGRLHG